MPHCWAVARRHWLSAKEAAGTTGLEPSTDTNVMWLAIIAARTGYTPDPTAMSAGIGVMRIGKKVIVTADTGTGAIVTVGTGTKAVIMDDTGRGAIVMAAIGAGIRIIATTPDAMRRLPAITDTAGITTGTRHATA